MQVLELMELAALASALVGVPGVSGLSVEQRKRLTIGVELVANPSIIFMVGTLCGGVCEPNALLSFQHMCVHECGWSWSPLRS